MREVTGPSTWCAAAVKATARGTYDDALLAHRACRAGGCPCACHPPGLDTPAPDDVPYAAPIRFAYLASTVATAADGHRRLGSGTGPAEPTLDPQAFADQRAAETRTSRNYVGALVVAVWTDAGGLLDAPENATWFEYPAVEDIGALADFGDVASGG